MSRWSSAFRRQFRQSAGKAGTPTAHFSPRKYHLARVITAGRPTVAGLSRLRLFYLLHLSKPASDRLVYREIRRLKARKVVELGLGAGQRAVHIIEVLKEFHEVRDIHYTGVDLFEARTAADGPGISLR